MHGMGVSVGVTSGMSQPIVYVAESYMIRLHLTATLLSEACHSVSIEPELQPITGENFTYATANV